MERFIVQLQHDMSLASVFLGGTDGLVACNQSRQLPRMTLGKFPLLTAAVWLEADDCPAEVSSLWRLCFRPKVAGGFRHSDTFPKRLKLPLSLRRHFFLAPVMLALAVWGSHTTGHTVQSLSQDVRERLDAHGPVTGHLCKFFGLGVVFFGHPAGPVSLSSAACTSRIRGRRPVENLALLRHTTAAVPLAESLDDSAARSRQLPH
eukprot:s4134_g10.t1